MSEEETEAGKLYHEIHGIVRRWCSEGDTLSTFGVIGALEAVKLDVLDMLARRSGTARPGDEEAS